MTRLVLQGASTAEIAERLAISAHTVQQHLYDEPRVSDNGQRAMAGRPGHKLLDRYVWCGGEAAAPHTKTVKEV